MVQARLRLASPPQPADAADAAALALCHLAMAPLRARIAAAATHAGAGDDRLAARRGARPLGRRHRAARGRAASATASRSRRGRCAELEPTSTGVPLRPPPRPRGRPDAVRLPRPRRADDVRGADRHPRRRPGAGAGDPRRPHRRPRSPTSSPATTSAPCTLVPGVGKKTAARLLVELKTRLSLPVLDDAAGGSAARCAGLGALGDVRDALAGLGYGPDEIRDALRELPDRRRRRARCCATRSSCSGPAVRDELLEPGRHRRRRGPCVEAGLRPAPCSPSSSASASSRSTSASSSRRPAGAARPSTTSCSPGRPGSARRRWPASSPAEMGVAAAHHVRPGARAGRRPGRHPHQARRGRRAVHRRDPPPVPRRRGDPLPGDGGLPARHRARQGPGGAAPSASTCRRSRWSAPPPAPGLITGPLRDRFGLVARLDYYDAGRPRGDRRAGPPASSACTIDDGGRREIARRARGTPRIANRLLRRVRDFAEVRGDGTVDAATRPDRAVACSASTSSASTRSTGPSSTALCERFGGGPVGLSTLAIRVGEQTETVEDVYEPFLIQQGLLMRTPRGRVATPAAWHHLGLDRRRPPHARPSTTARPVRLSRRAPCALDGPSARGAPWTELDYDLPDAASPSGRSSPATRPGCSSTAARRRRPPTATSPTCPTLLRPRRPPRRQRHPGAPGPPAPADARPAARPRCCCSSRTTRTRRTWEALVRPAGKLRARRPTLLGRDGRAGRARSATAPTAGDTFARRAARRRRRRSTLLDAHRRDAAAALHPRRRLADPSATRPSTPPGPARRPRRPPGCTSPTGVLDALPRRRASTVARVELVVGLDTFRPVTEDDPSRTTAMHTERYRVPADDAGRRARRGRAGGGRRHDDRAGPRVGGGHRARSAGRTDLFIHRRLPRSQVVDVLLTNFHLPRIVAADADRGVRRAPLARPLRRRRWPRATGSCRFGDAMLARPHADARRCMRSAVDVEATDGGGPRRRRATTARGTFTDAVLHAGRHPRRGAST